MNACINAATPARTNAPNASDTCCGLAGRQHPTAAQGYQQRRHQMHYRTQVLMLSLSRRAHSHRRHQIKAPNHSQSLSESFAGAGDAPCRTNKKVFDNN